MSGPGGNPVTETILPTSAPISVTVTDASGNTVTGRHS